MKLLSAKVIDGHLDLPTGTLEEGSTVTLLVPEDEQHPQLTKGQLVELSQSLSEAKRGEGVDGWQLLEKLSSS